MSYHFSKQLPGISFDAAVEKATNALKTEGFGVLTDIDIQQTLKNKINADFRKYRILGACNPHFAHQALQAEGHIGVFLPCNVIIQELEDGTVEVSAVDPVASMISVQNEQLGGLATEVQDKLKRVIAQL